MARSRPPNRLLPGTGWRAHVPAGFRLLFLIILLSGCANPTHRAQAEPGSAPTAEEDAESDAPPQAAADRAEAYPRGVKARGGLGLVSRKAASRAAEAGGASLANPAPAPAPPTSPEPPAAPTRPAGKRMVHYSGWGTLRSTEPEKVLDSAVALAESAGGYLEQRMPGFAALRVPSEAFDSAFVRLLRLADVVDYGQEAEDITGSFQDTEMRLRLVAATLDRLEDLVRKAKTEAQKLRLLRELKRLREERELLEARRKELVQKARYASIRLWVQGYAPQGAGGAWKRDFAAFRWIHGLNPFHDGRFRGRSTLRFPAPAGMVVSRKRRPWRATGSRGAEFWGSTLEVHPVGDSRFWEEAIRVRLKDGFKSAVSRDVGAFRFCRFQSFGPAPYFYWVGVRARGDEVDLAEFYFPDGSQQDEHLPAMLAAVEKEGKE